jgi:hypothetical protein
MAKLFLDKQEQGIVVFKTWQSLGYGKRLFLSFSLITAGLFLQLYFRTFLPGIVLVFLGNIFLLPSGYNQGVKIGRYNPKKNWEEVGEHKLREFLILDRKIKKWDISSLDITNVLGFFTFLLVIAVLGYFFWQSLVENNKSLQIIIANGVVLLFPYWLTGVRSIFTLPNVVKKTRLILKLLSKREFQARLKRHDVDYYFLLGGNKKVKLPSDVKFRVNIENRHKDFLGLYGQVVMNNVQSTPYPYFYVVLVARCDFGLKNVYKKYVPDSMFVKKFKVQKDVEVLVIRQNTRIRKGFYTRDDQVSNIFSEGLRLAEEAAVK